MRSSAPPHAPGLHAPRAVLTEVAQATLAVRLLAVAALIALNWWLPAGMTAALRIPLLGAATLYAIGLTLYGAHSPTRIDYIARWALPGDVALLWIGMATTATPAAFALLGVPLAGIAGLLVGYRAAGAVAAAVALAQIPPLPVSMFAPAQWVGWGVFGLTLVAAGAAGGAAADRLSARVGLTQALSDIAAAATAATAASATTATAETVLRIAVTHFRAGSGALALLDPVSHRLDVLASHALDPSTLVADAGAGQGVAGWVAQGGRATLLTPGSPVLLSLPSQHIRSSICVAATVEGRPAGLLLLNRSLEDAEFTKGDLKDAELVAATAAGYLLRVQNERAVSAALTALAGGHAKVSYALTRDPVVLWPALLDLVRSLTAARFAVLALEHEYTGNVEIVAARGLNGAAARTLLPPLLAAITMREVQITNGTPPSAAPAATCVPLSVGSRTIGALGLDLPETGPFPQTLLPAVAAHIAAAVDTARTAHRVADIGAAEERRRIAREMHDGLAQTLANALLQTDLSAMAAPAAPAELRNELRELRALLEQAIREMREFMAELRRTDDGDGRLFLALERMAAELERRHRVAIAVAAVGDDAHLPPAVRRAVLAIARQALANVQAHARATSINVRAEVTDEMCAVSVADNGIGFDVQAHRESPDALHHLGLPSMEERASLVGGRLAIESRPNRGTTVTVQVPLGVRHA